jgi:hypothetical protein
MVAPKLSPVGPQLTAAAVVVGGLTGLGIGLALLWPHLGGRVAPHAALDGNFSDALAILANNLRVVAVPFGVALLGLARTRTGRTIGELTVIAVASVNAVPVGLALGRWQGRLVPYVPQLPLEWAALATSLTAWLQARTGTLTGRQISLLAASTVFALAAAAAVETWCTPHRHPRNHPEHGQSASDGTSDLTACGMSGGLTVGPEYAPAAARSLQGRALPSPHCVRFRSAATPALTGLTSTHRPPQGGIT